MHKLCNFNQVFHVEIKFLALYASVLFSACIMNDVMCFTQTHLPQFQHKMSKAALWRTKRTHRMAVGVSSGPISAARYLVLLGDVLLVILLHLPELGLQPTQLDLHLLHILQVPLGSLVQHLNGLGHVLDLGRWTDWLDGPTKSVSFIKSLIRSMGIGTTQQTFSVLLWLSDSWTTTREPGTHEKCME